MDQPGLAPPLHHKALDGLRRLNWISGTVRTLWNPIKNLWRESAPQPLRVLDVACGGGDVAIGLANRAQRNQIAVCVDGCDISPLAIAHAAARAERSGLRNARFFALDILQEQLPVGYDVVICSLFLHHLDDRDIIRSLRNMATATRQLLLIDDIRRSRLGYAMAWIGCRILSRSQVVRIDGLRSIASALTATEAKRLAERAGLVGFEIKNHWPERFLLSWRVSAGALGADGQRDFSSHGHGSGTSFRFATSPAE